MTGKINRILKEEKRKMRKAAIQRETTETNVSLEIDLDGTGKSHIETEMCIRDRVHSRHGIARRKSTVLCIGLDE